MSSTAKPLLHTVHVLTFVVLFGTGLLLFLPGLRAAVTGGYSQVIRSGHRWGGLAYAVLPLLVIARFGPRAVFMSPSHPSLRSRLQGAHTLVTYAVGVVFVLTGAVMWAKDSVSEALFDAAQTTHDGLTWAVAVLVALHLAEVSVTAVATRMRGGA